jgi:hypothetical protein
MTIIYVVEDDYLQLEYVCRILQDEFGPDVEVRSIRTESEFWRRFEEIASAQPACVVLDILIQWAEAAVSNESRGPGSFRTAGLRCQKKLSEDARTKNISVIFYTVLDRSDVLDFPREVHYLRKDVPDERFLALVRTLVTTGRHGNII